MNIIHKCKPGWDSAPVFLWADPHCINCTITGDKVCTVLLLTEFVKDFFNFSEMHNCRGYFCATCTTPGRISFPSKCTKTEFQKCAICRRKLSRSSRICIGKIAQKSCSQIVQHAQASGFPRNRTFVRLGSSHPPKSRYEMYMYI